MRILCVNNKPVANSFNYAPVLAAIKEGEVYEGHQAEGEAPDGTFETVWLIPALSKNHGYAFERFVPASDLDETALVTEEFEEKYCVPVKK